jgi:hypothetical protein
VSRGDPLLNRYSQYASGQIVGLRHKRGPKRDSPSPLGGIDWGTVKDEKAQRLALLEPRVARRRMEELEAAIPALRLARGVLHRLERSDAALVREIDSLSDELNYLRQLGELPVWPRERPKLHARQEGDPVPIYHVYLDECGTKDPKPQISFPFLSMAAVIIERGYYHQTFCPRARELKNKYWPGRDMVFHEPDMRKRLGKFAFSGDMDKWAEFYGEYKALLADTDFIAVGVVLDKAKLFKLYNVTSPDPYLPRDAYAIAYDYLLESVCYVLYHECDNAIGCLYPESIQAKSDALLQIEHSRIPSWHTPHRRQVVPISVETRAAIFPEGRSGRK